MSLSGDNRRYRAPAGIGNYLKEAFNHLEWLTLEITHASCRDGFFFTPPQHSPLDA